MTYVKDNFFVLTGGPGGGKSTLLKALHTKRFNFIEETARHIIKERILNGMPPRPSPLEFGIQMFEKDLQNFTHNSIQTNIIFFDRSFMDSAALIYEADTGIFSTVSKKLSPHIASIPKFLLRRSGTKFSKPMVNGIKPIKNL